MSSPKHRPVVLLVYTVRGHELDIAPRNGGSPTVESTRAGESGERGEGEGEVTTKKKRFVAGFLILT